MTQTLRQHCDTRLKEMDADYATWEAHYKDLNDNVSTRSGRFQPSDRNKGDKRNSKIINETATFSLETLERGLFDGATNPANPWLRVKTPYPELNKKQAVREWLDTYGDRILEVFRRSNFYAEIPNVYSDLGLYGTASCLIEKDPDSIIRAEHLATGSYRLGMSGKRRVNAMGRTFQKTRRELVDLFGEENVTQATKDAVTNNAGADQNVEVRHLIELNPNYKKGSPFAKFMKFRSIYYETSAEDGKFLQQGGYNTFPVIAPRWRVRGGDTYGESQAMSVLGTIKELQLLEKDFLTITKKIAVPPLTGPTTMKNKLISQLSGSVTLHDATAGTPKIEPMFQINPQSLDPIQVKIKDCEARIREGMFTNLFLMLASLPDRADRTAEEMRMRLKEMIRTLGPVLVRLFDEVLDPAIEIVTEIMADPDFPGLIPEAPQELQGMPLNVEYVSELAQAMKMARVGLVENAVAFVMNAASQQAQMRIAPDALDKLNLDEAIDSFGELSGTPAKLLNDAATALQIRQGRAQAQEQQQQMAEAQQQAAMVKDLANAPADTDSVLSRMGGAA